MALTGLLMPFNRKMGMNYLTDVIRNKINDDTRPDKDSFGWIDKSFAFKKFVPSVEFNLEYKW